jgi:aerobic carbon-monoxide dehydrogenase large subunit
LIGALDTHETAPAAIINALIDALASLGVTDLAMPATSESVWRAIAERTRI